MCEGENGLDRPEGQRLLIVLRPCAKHAGDKDTLWKRGIATQNKINALILNDTQEKNNSGY